VWLLDLAGFGKIAYTKIAHTANCLHNKNAYTRNAYTITCLQKLLTIAYTKHAVTRIADTTTAYTKNCSHTNCCRHVLLLSAARRNSTVHEHP
jgi:hypothetical protein